VPVVDITTTAGGTTVFTLEAFEAANAGLKGFLNKSRVAASSANKPPVPLATNPWILGGSGITLAGLILFTLPRRRRNRWSALLITLISVGVLAASGCSQSSSTATNGNINATPGTYSITVTAQATNAAGTVLTHNVAVTFVVQ
jgi:surface-anchored protein